MMVLGYFLALIKLYLKPKKCDCGENTECARKINSNSEGRLWIDNENHFKCGEIRNQINDLIEVFKI